VLNTPLFIKTVAAHGCWNQAQENPLGEGEQADACPPLKPLPELGDPHEKEDISLQISLSPQEGQTNESSLSEDRINCSNILPHFLHLNS
jgi:hypothetical protein